MESFCTRSKRRPPLPGAFYPPPYNATFHQNEYSLGLSLRQSALLWREQSQPNVSKSKGRGRSCSIALAVTSLIILIAVISIAGLALYISTLKGESGNPLLVFSCSVKILRGDRFIGNLQEKSRRYKNLLEILYQRSPLSSALVGCNVEKFGNDTQTIYYKITLNKRKIPRPITNIEKVLRDALLSDALSKKPVFKNIRFDSRSVSVRLVKEQNSYQRTPKPKAEPNSKLATTKLRIEKHKDVPKKKPEIQEVALEEENLPVIQGSFQISKTEADISVNKKLEKNENLQGTVNTSLYYKTSSIDQVSKPTIKTVTETTTTTTTTKATTETTISTTKPTVKLEISEKSDFVPSELLNNEPWIPIISKEKSPTYTSFTNPALTFRLTDNDNLNRHPIPINKIFEATQSSTSTTTESFDFIGNVTAFFETLASSFLSSPKETVSSTESFGQGQVEVVEPDDLLSSVITTKLPLVTLMPVKSNSGIGRPLRKRPSFDVENRSFFKKQEDQSATTKSVSDFKIMGMLNFHQDTPFESSGKGLIRNQKAEPEIDDVEIERIISGENSNISVLPGDSTLSELKELPEMSNLSQNYSTGMTNSKAVRVSYSINLDEFTVFTKSYNKSNNDKDVEDFEQSNLPIPVNVTECTENTIKCDNGKCVPSTARCNQLIDCQNGRDEQNCTCADYLKSQLLKQKICDGVVDCWDFTDENECDWCSPDNYVCANSKLCIEKSKICDGINHCPLGDDERRCVTIADGVATANEYSYYAEGFLLVRKFGEWGKLCVDNLKNKNESTNSLWGFQELGQLLCNAISYQAVEDAYAVSENISQDNFFEIGPKSPKSDLTFNETSCPSRNVLKIKCSNLECGTKPPITHMARIVGGINAGLGSWPWQAALYKEGEFQCGATLLSDRWLISAGHCFYHTMDEHWVARLGTLRRGTTLTSPYEHLRYIIKIIIHPEYVNTGFINDISLLKMETPVTFNDYIRPICLPREKTSVSDGTMCTVIGWGQLFETGRIFPDTLQEVEIPVISTEECRKRTVFLPLYKITDDMLCAGFDRGGRDACLGDSGGGLMCPESDGRWVLQGVTSNGYGCARKDRPGVYTKVSNYIGWIQSNINSHNESTPSSKSTCSGHRCPLGDCLPPNRLCNGYIECSDGSDEMHCLE